MLIDTLSESRVLIIDDVEADVRDIKEALDNKKIKYTYVDASPENITPLESRIDSIELVFLDLYFNKNFGAEIEAEKCVQIIGEAISVGKEYYLVIWSRDAEQAEDVLQELDKHGLSPVKAISRKKDNYFIKTGYDIDRLFEDINSEFDNIEIIIEEIEGQILHIEDDSILIDCILDPQNKVIQKRRFDILPFTNIKKLKSGNFITIKIVTKPGSKLYEFYNNPKDLKEFFNKDQFFEGIDENSFK